MSTSITSTPQQRLTYEEISQLNQRKDELKDKPYAICYLHVGKKFNDREIPKFFLDDEDLHIAYIFYDEEKVLRNEFSIKFKKYTDTIDDREFYNGDILIFQLNPYLPIFGQISDGNKLPLEIMKICRQHIKICIF